ncbi:MAG TPA: hypothetical protein VFS00_05175 [Polyangiaceae bacterium]|nr:hypothetical protein [Polyangiaceae bacterium]
MRPHEALGQATPASHYHASRRPMPAAERSPTYGESLEVRVLAPNGRLAWQEAQTYVTRRLTGEPVGLEPLDGEHARLYYGPRLLGEVRRKGRSLELRKARDGSPGA